MSSTRFAVPLLISDLVRSQVRPASCTQRASAQRPRHRRWCHHGNDGIDWMVLQRRDNMARLQGILASESFSSQAEFGRRVCDVLRRLRETGCTAALVAMERKGHITAVPKREVTSPAVPRRPVCLDAPVPPPINGSPRVDLVQGLHLVRVADDGQKRLYNRPTQHEHARGAAMPAATCAL